MKGLVVYNRDHTQARNNNIKYQRKIQYRFFKLKIEVRVVRVKDLGLGLGLFSDEPRGGGNGKRDYN